MASDVSGAQWSPARLGLVAERLKRRDIEAADALRAFARLLEEGVTCPECHGRVLLNEETKL